MASENRDLVNALAAILGGLTVLAGALGVMFYFSEPRKQLRACDAEIQRHLKAPSTYRRIDNSEFGSPIRITYEAQNSFGVPLRSSGYCRIANATGAVIWTELPGS